MPGWEATTVLWNRKNNKWSRPAAAAAIIGLVFQAFVSAFSLPAHALESGVRGDDPFRTLTICTSQGLVRIVLDAEGNPVDQSQSGGPSFACTVCCVMAGSRLVVPAAVEWPIGDARREKFTLRVPANPVAGRIPMNRKGHDPPLPA